MQYSNTPKSEYASHNLYKHLADHDTVHGEVEAAKPGSLGTWMELHPWARFTAMAAIGLGAVTLPALALRSQVKRLITWKTIIKLIAWRFM